MTTGEETKRASVLRADPDLGAGLGAEERRLAERSCLARVLEIPTGSWDSDSAPGVDRAGLGLLVLSGTLCRRVVQGRLYGAELIGPGDVLRPWDRVGEWSSIATASDWLVIDHARLAILDTDFSRAAAPYPEIAVALVGRALQRSRYLAILTAIISQRRVDTRLVMLFWHLADRFGHTHGDRVDVPLPLTHSLLAELVAARRPSVSTALARLHESGELRRAGRGWRLRGSPPAEFEAAAAGPTP